MSEEKRPESRSILPSVLVIFVAAVAVWGIIALLSPPSGDENQMANPASVEQDQKNQADNNNEIQPVEPDQAATALQTRIIELEQQLKMANIKLELSKANTELTEIYYDLEEGAEVEPLAERVKDLHQMVMALIPGAPPDMINVLSELRDALDALAQKVLDKSEEALADLEMIQFKIESQLIS